MTLCSLNHVNRLWLSLESSVNARPPKAGLRGLGDLYLDTQCTKASLKLRQPPDTYTNDDGVLPPLVAIAQSP
jgi:hypothetical protein